MDPVVPFDSYNKLVFNGAVSQLVIKVLRCPKSTEVGHEVEAKLWDLAIGLQGLDMEGSRQKKYRGKCYRENSVERKDFGALPGG